MKWHEESGMCLGNHVIGCPRKEWKPGCVFRSWFDGREITARVFRTAEEAERFLVFQETRLARARYEYEYVLKIAVPPQYYKWTHAIWNGEE